MKYLNQKKILINNIYMYMAHSLLTFFMVLQHYDYLRKKGAAGRKKASERRK